ncbi:hypothetical protein AVEN_264576-1 [Araneus ventricosus]|uniref:Retrotransposon gag domain-containing protein n=1 Tax=Araneus ventricosus TaxID=182803 RepID=A0A4Y2TK49_ARAVE|nr:hypothetical protein AVEN_264576-1 [Araneus ventricosus]
MHTFFLDGTAKKWFDNNEDLLTSWEVFQTELKKVFGDTQLYVRRAKDILKCRAQKSGESTQSYIQDVLGLCHLIDSNMPEDDKVSHLMKGIAVDVYQALLTKEMRTTADFIKWCQHIEEMHERRIGHTKFTRLPNVVPIASIDTENDLTSLIPNDGANTRSLPERPTCGVPLTIVPSAFIVDVPDTLYATAKTAELFSTLIAEIKDETLTHILMTPAPPRRPANKPPDPHHRIQIEDFRLHAVIDPCRHTVEAVYH